MSHFKYMIPGMFCLAGFGCFPIELDVNDKGELLIARQEGFFIYNPLTRTAKGLIGPGGGQPVFARFAPNGVEALLVVKTNRDDYRFDLFAIDAGERPGGERPVTVLTTQNAAYVSYSPDSKYIAVSRFTEKERPGVPDSKIPELMLIDLLTEERVPLMEDMLIAFRWLSDSKRLVLFKIQSEDKDHHMTCQLSELNIETRKETPLAAAITEKMACIELSPDNRTILFTALAAGQPDDKLHAPKDGRSGLYEWNAADRTVRKHPEPRVDYVKYSPSGKKLLYGKRNERERDEIYVNAAGNDRPATLLAADVHIATNGNFALPGWLNEETIFYFVERSNYGSGGSGIKLMTIGANGANPRSAQPALDKAVLSLAGGLPNFEGPPGIRDLEFFPLNFGAGPGFRDEEDLLDLKNPRTYFFGGAFVILFGFVLFVFFLLLRKPPPFPKTWNEETANAYRTED